MKKGEVKNILKYIVISILVVCFMTDVAYTIIGYVNSKITLEYLYTEKYENQEYVNYLESRELWITQVSNQIKEVTGETDESYPITGAAIDQLTVLGGIDKMQMLTLSTILGVIIGISYYVIKKDYKKIVHYIALFVLTFLIINMLIAICIMITENVGSARFYISSVGYETYIGIAATLVIPYIIIYVLGGLIVYLVNKKRIEKLNGYIKNK